MKKPYVIGIAGGSASGKSYLCDKLERSLKDLKVEVIHMDDYFKQETQRPYSKAFISDRMYVDDNHPQTMDLPQLSSDLEKLLEQGGMDVIVIEGLLTLWDKNIYEKLDLKLFVDCRADERIVRRLKRNMQWGLTFDEISNVYLDMVRYRHDEYVEPSRWRADIIFNGSHFSEKALDVIVNHIRSYIA